MEVENGKSLRFDKLASLTYQASMIRQTSFFSLFKWDRRLNLLFTNAMNAIIKSNIHKFSKLFSYFFAFSRDDCEFKFSEKNILDSVLFRKDHQQTKQNKTKMPKLLS